MTDASKRYLRDCMLLARAAGYGHDIGKVADFQDKIRSPFPLVDPVRHEWISLFVLRSMLQGRSWQQAWDDIASHHPPEERWTDVTPFDGALIDLRGALLYLVATHHRLPTMLSAINHYNHVRDDEHVACRKGDLGPAAMAALEATLADINAADAENCADPAKDRLYWRAVATMSRVALILADQTVSMQMIYEPDNATGTRLYANTDRATKQMNQSLDWHLLEVGNLAATMVGQIEAYTGPSLTPDVALRIYEEASRKRRYLWQTRAARALRRSHEANACPHLVLNMAATGTGKTRMNVRAVCALGAADGSNVRFMSALNLRTLTLQTRDAYAEQMLIPRSMMAGIIGDKPTLKMHNYQKQLARQQRSRSAADDAQLVDDDENVLENQFESVSEYRYTDAPPWLSKFLLGRPLTAAVIGAPVLVSTIDFLIAAGEPQMQGNHALALLRLKTSDLILDEIDSYDPQAFLSVMRLVTLSAFFGRNVIASSATLSRPVARMLWQSFQTGCALRARRTGGAARFVTAIIDNDCKPTVASHRKADGFMRGYEAHVKRMLRKLKGRTERRCLLQEVTLLSEEGWLKSVHNACKRLHEQNCWTDPATRRKLSIGLVRVANIHAAVKVAHYLSEAFGDEARIVCYHSQHFMLQRFHIEHKLDKLLSRHDGSAHILADPDVRAALDQAKGKAVRFIVVATPVEEIGRDHDFDWAVLEPSSIQSLIQAAGRVNRHRLVKLGWYRFRHPHKKDRRKSLRCNVAILQYNYRAIVHMYRDPSYRAFCQPGLEMEWAPYPTHNLLEMLDWDLIRIEQIDARQRFYDAKIDRRRRPSNVDATRRHSFAVLDDAAMEDATRDIFARMSGNTTRGHEWMGLNTYLDSPLRERSTETVNLIWREPAPNNVYLCRLNGTVSSGQLLRMPVCVPRVDNDWLMLSEDELIAKARAANLNVDDAMQVNISAGKLSRDGTLAQDSLLTYAVHDRSFGFFRDTQR